MGWRQFNRDTDGNISVTAYNPDNDSIFADTYYAQESQQLTLITEEQWKQMSVLEQVVYIMQIPPISSEQWLELSIEEKAAYLMQ